jgi:MFS family permease
MDHIPVGEIGSQLPMRNRALGYWGAVGSAGAIVGQLLGGVVTTAFGWRAIFLINVPIGIVTIAAAAPPRRDGPTTPSPSSRVLL